MWFDVVKPIQISEQSDWTESADFKHSFNPQTRMGSLHASHPNDSIVFVSSSPPKFSVNLNLALGPGWLVKKLINSGVAAIVTVLMVVRCRCISIQADTEGRVKCRTHVKLVTCPEVGREQIR